MQVVNFIGHHVGPIYDIPIFGYFFQECFGVCADVSGGSFVGEEDFPWFNDECFLFGEGHVGGGCHFYEAELTDDVLTGEVVGEELVDIVGILKEGFGDDVLFFEEVVDDLLEVFVHLRAHSHLYDADYFVIVLQTDVDFSHS
jgi:hypothetical protein